MLEPSVSDASSQVSLLIENSNGTFEIILQRREIEGKLGFLPVQLITLSGPRPLMPTHSCLGNAMSMQKWMEENRAVFEQGRTSFQP